MVNNSQSINRPIQLFPICGNCSYRSLCELDKVLTAEFSKVITQLHEIRHGYRITLKYFFDMKKDDLQSHLRDVDPKVSGNTQSYYKHKK